MLSPIFMNFGLHRHKNGPEFLPTLSILFRPQSVAHTLQAALMWRPMANLNETALGLFAAQTLTWQWHHIGRP